MPGHHISHSLLDCVVAGELLLNKKGADITAGLSKQPVANTSMAPLSKAQLQAGGALHSQPGHAKGGLKAPPLQLMLCQWGLPKKVVQVCLVPLIL